MPAAPSAETAIELNLFADLLPLGVCLIDGEFQVLHWNETLVAWTGQRAADMLCHNLLELFPNLRESGYQEQIEGVLASGQMVQFCGREHCHFIPAGSEEVGIFADSVEGNSAQLMVQRTTVRRHPTEPAWALIMIEDVTAEHRQAVARLEQQKRLEALSRQLAASMWQHGEFMANMSQELRLSLNTIFGYAEFLREREPTPDRRAALEGLRRNGERLLTVINDSLDFTKIEAQQVCVERVRFELLPLLSDIVSLVRLTAAENDTQFVFECEPDLPETLLSDPTRLRQILLNLLGNAVTFTEAGKVRMEVSLKTTPGGQELEFVVADTGVGIAPERLRKLFQPFSNQASGGTASRKRGTGLGLAISDRLTRLLGGRLEAASEVGQGSTFVLTLPLVGK